MCFIACSKSYDIPYYTKDNMLHAALCPKTSWIVYWTVCYTIFSTALSLHEYMYDFYLIDVAFFVSRCDYINIIVA